MAGIGEQQNEAPSVRALVVFNRCRSPGKRGSRCCLLRPLSSRSCQTRWIDLAMLKNQSMTVFTSHLLEIQQHFLRLSAINIFPAQYPPYPFSEPGSLAAFSNISPNMSFVPKIAAFLYLILSVAASFPPPPQNVTKIDSARFPGRSIRLPTRR